MNSWRSCYPFSIFMCALTCTSMIVLITKTARCFGWGPRMRACSLQRRQRRRRDREREGEQTRGGRLIKQGEEERRWRTTLIEQSRSHWAYQRDLPTHTPWPASQSEHSHPWPILPRTTAHPWLSEADVRWCGRKQGCEPAGQKIESHFVYDIYTEERQWFDNSCEELWARRRTLV